MTDPKDEKNDDGNNSNDDSDQSPLVEPSDTIYADDSESSKTEL